MLPKIPNISQVAPGIVRILGLNPSSMTLQGTNSYLIGTPDVNKLLLIDTSNPGQSDYIEQIKHYLQKTCKSSPKISDILVTHWHPDHIGSVPGIIDLAESLKWPIPNVYKFPSKSNPAPNMNLLENNQVMDLSKFGMGSLQILYTPGHTDDHICILLSPENILFCGDLILGNGSTTFEDLVPYMDSLRKVEKISDKLKMMLPGHGVEITDPVAKTKEYLKHRLQRIDEVSNSLLSTWQSEMDIIVKVYPPDVINNPVLFFGALKNQYQALKYLLNEKIADDRDCTDEEKKHQKHSLSGKMWKLKDKIQGNL